MKDLFSKDSGNYASYRPGYPPEIIEEALKFVPGRKVAWDCGTGNGQLARFLAEKFETVYATDISEQQLKQAPVLPNVLYSAQPAERTNLADQSVDLITVGQAIHWFDFERFYSEVFRTLVPGGHLLILGYSLLEVMPETDRVIHRLYYEFADPYWDPERHYLDEGYRTIPFPLEEISLPEIRIRLTWTLPHLLGYLKTWSAVKHFEKDRGENPVDLLENDFRKAWGKARTRAVHFPLLVRFGRKRG